MVPSCICHMSWSSQVISASWLVHLSLRSRLLPRSLIRLPFLLRINQNVHFLILLKDSLLNIRQCPYLCISHLALSWCFTWVVVAHQDGRAVMMVSSIGMWRCLDWRFHMFVVGLLGRMGISASLPKIESVGLVSLILCRLASHGHDWLWELDSKSCSWSF